MDREQPAPPTPNLDRPAPHTGTEQLPSPNHTVLPSRKPSNRPIYSTRRAFATYNVVDALLVRGGPGHTPMLAQASTQVAR
jgi:hypothetical protein